ncbi:MAG TPA: DUF1761 domain-containing protein [Patescibacteria group bacterium]|nr:DUF1761 domain-containing protein [Patescibacteria group bacterium]
MDITVNYLAVLIAGVASMAVGFLWYSPAMFAKQWMKLSGINEKDINQKQKEMGKLYGLSFALSLVTAYVLFHVMAMSRAVFDYDPVMTGITSAFWMWLGFVMPIQMTDFIFQGREMKLVMINTGYQLISLIAMGIVIGSFS